jgi:HlyD family secretion protein
MSTVDTIIPAPAPQAPPASAPAHPGQALFRESTVKRMSSPERLDMAAAIVRPSAWMLLAVCLIAVIGAVAAGIFIKIPIKVAAQGIILNIAGVKEVVASAAGQLKTLKVKVGDHVAAGAAIAQVEQPDLRQEIAAAEAEVTEAKVQIEKVSAMQTRARSTQDELRAQQRDNLAKSVAASEQRVAALTDRLRDFEELSTRGIVTKQRLLDARNELNQTSEELARNRNSLKQTEVEEENQRNEREREQLNLSLKLATAERKFDQLKERMGRVDIVTSPYSGRVAEIKVNEGEVVERGVALATIVPDVTAPDGSEVQAPLVATLYVPAANGKKVRPGMGVEIMPATVKREERGYIVARITAVSEVPATQEGMIRVLKNRQLAQTLAEGGSPFEVRAELVPNAQTPSGLQWSSSTGPDEQISSGSPCKAEVITRSEPVLQILLPATRAFFTMFKS